MFTSGCNIGCAAFDFPTAGYVFQTNEAINTPDMGSFKLVAIILCSEVHFYVEPPYFDLNEVAQDQISRHKKG